VLVDNEIAAYAQLGSPAAPPCTAGQLVAARPLLMEGVTGDEIAGAVALRNVSRAACTVRGDPRLELVTAAGEPLPLTERAWPQTLGRMAHWWGYPGVSIRPGHYAWAQLTSVLGCGARATTADVELPGGVVPVAVDGRSGLRRPCYHPLDPVTVNVFEFVPQPAPPAPPVKQVRLEVTLSAPHDVRAGELVRYRMTIGNAATTSYRFRRCPAYWQGIRQRRAVPDLPDDRRLRAFRLNCGPVGTLLPMTERTFAMVLRVPASLQPGRALLVWGFAPNPLPASDYSIGTSVVDVEG